MMNNTFNGKLAQLDLLDKYGKYVSKQHGDIEFPEGWIDLERQIFEAFKQDGDDDIRLQHIVAQDGRLEVFYEGGDTKLFEKIKKITYQSHFLCDHCGEKLELNVTNPTHRCERHSMRVEYLFEPKQIELLKRRYTATRKGFRLENDDDI